jgi:predicted alpha/beta-hydrolase family hydrolase
VVEPLDVFLPQVPGLVVDPGAAPPEAPLKGPDKFKPAPLKGPDKLKPGVPVLLTHGAGGDVHGAGLTALAEGLAALGHTVVRFNLPYRVAGRSSPPPAEKSVPGYREGYEAARQAVGGSQPWAVGGKSYGGRVASLAVAEGMEVAALVFYGYPLHPPGKPESLRVAHWPSITVPSLFLEGTDDPFCNLDLLREHLPLLGGPATLHVVEGGDHSLQVRASKSADGKPRSQARVMADLAPVVSAWLESVAVRS